MVSLSAWGSVLDWVFKRVDQVSGFFKRSFRRKNVQNFEKNVNARDSKSIARSLRKLRAKTKNRNDSR
jgi:hypothetical protein|tara:strand:- start:9104 stop:9307 length:204 start_codon:yes stop_codon:yes gene_type:complete